MIYKYIVTTLQTLNSARYLICCAMACCNILMIYPFVQNRAKKLNNFEISIYETSYLLFPVK